MTYRKPFLQVIGPSDEDMLATWGSRLIGVKLVDRQDSEHDEATFIFTRKRPYMPIPGEGTPYIVRFGWSGTLTVVAGIYNFQSTRIFGNPKQGQQLHLICRAGSLSDYFRRVDSEHYDKENGHKTLGDVFRTLFKSGGKAVEVHPDIDKLPVPGDYALRWNQGPMDFAMDLADEVGALIKPSGDKVIVLKRGSGESVSGRPLPTIAMPFSEDYEFDVQLEPQFSYERTSASYLDTDKGRLERALKDSGKSGAGNALPHPYPDKNSAQAAAEAAAAELRRFTANGLFTKAGDPTAVSGAPVACSGYGTPIDEIEWEAVTVTHDIVPQVGWTTTTETQAKD